VPLPVNLDADDARAIIDGWRWAFAEGFKPAEIGHITGGALLKTIAHYIQQASQGQTP